MLPCYMKPNKNIELINAFGLIAEYKVYEVCYLIPLNIMNFRKQKNESGWKIMKRYLEELQERRLCSEAGTEVVQKNWKDILCSQIWKNCQMFILTEQSRGL